MTIQEGNVLIAEFMGYEIREHTPDSKPPFLVRYKDGIWAGEWATNGADKYNTSWDWLMPVVEKIEATVCISCNRNYLPSVTLGSNCCVISPFFGKTIIGDGNSKIAATWQAVIKFIKWYNEYVHASNYRFNSSWRPNGH